MFNEQSALILRKLLKLRGWTQLQLARKVRINPAMVNRHLHHQRPVLMGHAEKYLRYMTRSLGAAFVLALLRDNNIEGPADLLIAGWLDFAPGFIWGADATGACNFVSAWWTKFTGQTFEEALGDGWLKKIHPRDRERTARIWIKAQASRAEFLNHYRLKNRKDGKYHWIYSRGLPRFDEEKHLIGYIGFAVEVPK